MVICYQLTCITRCGFRFTIGVWVWKKCQAFLTYYLESGWGHEKKLARLVNSRRLWVDKSVISGIFGNCNFRPRIVRVWPQKVTLILNRTSHMYLFRRMRWYLGLRLRTIIRVLNPSNSRVMVRVIYSTGNQSKLHIITDWLAIRSNPRQRSDIRFYFILLFLFMYVRTSTCVPTHNKAPIGATMWSPFHLSVSSMYYFVYNRR